MHCMYVYASESLKEILFVSVNCEWGSWSSFSTCTKTCGGGIKYRSRSKSVSEKDGGTCSGGTTEEESCNTQNCPGEKLIYVFHIILHEKSMRKSKRNSDVCVWFEIRTKITAINAIKSPPGLYTVNIYCQITITIE